MKMQRIKLPACPPVTGDVQDRGPLGAWEAKVRDCNGFMAEMTLP